MGTCTCSWDTLQTPGRFLKKLDFDLLQRPYSSAQLLHLKSWNVRISWSHINPWHARVDSEPSEVTLKISVGWVSERCVSILREKTWVAMKNSSEETCHGWPPWLQISIHQDCTAIYHHEPSTIIYHHLPSTVIKSWTNCCGKYWNGDNWWPPADFSWPSFSALVFQRFCRLHWPLGGLPLEDIKIHGASCENMSEPPIDSWVYQTQVTRAYHQVRQRLHLVKI